MLDESKVTLAQKSEAFLAKPQIHEAWESDYLNSDLDQFYDDAISGIAQIVPPSSHPSLLDAGCGYGYHSVRLAKHGYQVTGFDFSESALAEAKRYITSEGLESKISLRGGNITQLDLPDSNFDVVFCWGVLMHVPDLATALAELVRVLRPGGRLVLAENSAHSMDVRVIEPIARMLKRLLGRQMNERVWNERGVEEWTKHDQGGLLVRKTDFAFLEEFLTGVRMTKLHHYTSQYTEIYNRIPIKALKRIIYEFNRIALASRSNIPYSMTSILIFEKS